ncbi:MAG: leucine-rich repeat protein [Clostridia bacterium]|nr:leucine-rich repeat protein [Clostridia bacterium]
MKKSRKILLSLLATLMVGAACQLFENRIVYILSEDKSYYIIKDIFNCTETNLIIPSTHGGKPVREIGNSAFRDCSSLTSVVIGDSVTSIGNSAFYDCTKLTSVYYKGTASDWSAISIDNTYGYNNSLINATRYYYSENQPTEEGNYWHYVDGKPTIWE